MLNKCKCKWVLQITSSFLSWFVFCAHRNWLPVLWQLSYWANSLTWDLPSLLVYFSISKFFFFQKCFICWTPSNTPNLLFLIFIPCYSYQNIVLDRDFSSQILKHGFKAYILQLLSLPILNVYDKNYKNPSCISKDVIHSDQYDGFISEWNSSYSWYFFFSLETDILGLTPLTYPSLPCLS